MMDDIKEITDSIRRELQSVSSWGGDVRGAIYDLSTNNYTPSRDNQQAINETSKDRGVDGFTQQVPVDQNAGTSASSLAGFYFYFADGTELFIARSTALSDYDSTTDTSWSIVFPVSGGAIDTAGTITYDATTTLYDGDASADPVEAQTFYRLPLIRGVDLGSGVAPQTLSSGGVYRENIFCDSSKGPIVELIKIA